MKRRRRWRADIALSFRVVPAHERTGVARADAARSEVRNRLVEAVLVDHFEQLVVVAIVDVNADDDRPVRLECLLHHGDNFFRRSDHQAFRAESLCIFDIVDRAKIDSGCAPVLRLFLDGHHVVCAVSPNHVHQVRLEAHGGLQLHGGKQEAAVAGDRENLFPWSDHRGRDTPGKGHAQGLLTVCYKDVARSEAVQMPCDPEVERAHVQAERGVTANKLLQFVHEPQRMYRAAAANCCSLLRS